MECKITVMIGAAAALGLLTLATPPAQAADATPAPAGVQAVAYERALAALQASRAAKAQPVQGKQADSTVEVRRSFEIRHPDGSVERKLGEEDTMYATASVEGDGSLKMDCLPSDEAKALVSAKASQPAANASKGAQRRAQMIAAAAASSRPLR